MEKKDLIPGGDAIHHLKNATLHPQRRGEMSTCALQELLTNRLMPCIGVSGL